MAFLFLAMGLLDHARADVLARAGARFQARMDARVTGAILTRAGRSTEARSAPATGLADRFVFSPWESGDKVITDFGNDDVIVLLEDTSAGPWPPVTDILGSQTQTQAGTYVYDLRPGLIVETHAELAADDFEVE